jgi:hypothetical protein
LLLCFSAFSCLLPLRPKQTLRNIICINM